MGKNESVWFIIICSYFIFYLIKLVAGNSEVISKNNVFNSLKNKMKSIFQSDTINLKNNFEFKNIKKNFRTLFIMLLGFIMLIIFIPLLLILQILKWPIIFLNKIISIEKDEGFEFFKYIILPLILGVIFVKFFDKSYIHGTSIEVIISFYDKLVELQLLYIMLIIILSVLGIYGIFRFISRNEELFIIDIFNYLYKWIQVFTFVIIYLAILATYFLSLDEVNDRITLFDSYTIIPIFITSCITSSNIIIMLLTKINIDKVDINRVERTNRPKRYPYIRINHF